jgi:nucleoside-diphosphate-sugar epimerase
MKYFVTGATGFLGGELARQLIAAGHDVVALVRTPAKADALRALGPRMALAAGDITDAGSLRAPMTGVDGIFHCAAWYKVGVKNDEAERINVDGTRNVLHAMRDLKIPKGVYTSTLAVFSDTHGREVDESYFTHPDPFLSEYDRTKWLAHYEVALPLMREGLPLVIVQPGAIYGPGDTSGLRTMMLDYLHRRLPAIPARTAFSWGYIEDVAKAHILAMEKGRVGESYIICGPSHTLTEVFALAEKITGIPAGRLHPSPGLLKAAAGMMGVVAKITPFNLPTTLQPETLRVLAGVTYLGSNAKARRELGYAPRSLDEGLRQTLAHEMRQDSAIAVTRNDSQN